MNNNNVMLDYRGGVLYAICTTRGYDDPDDDGTPVFNTQSAATSIDDRQALKNITTDLVAQYDYWVDTIKYAEAD